MTTNEIQHLPDQRRFQITVDGDTAVLDYRLQGTAMLIHHTGVPPALENRGIGSRLAQVALDFAARNHFEVVPHCSFIAAYIRRHPEYRGLLRAGFAAH